MQQLEHVVHAVAVGVERLGKGHLADAEEGGGGAGRVRGAGELAGAVGAEGGVAGQHDIGNAAAVEDVVGVGVGGVLQARLTVGADGDVRDAEFLGEQEGQSAEEAGGGEEEAGAGEGAVGGALVLSVHCFPCS